MSSVSVPVVDDTRTANTSAGGGGGGLGWANDIAVTPGETIQVQVGAAPSPDVGGYGTDSYFKDTSTCVGYSGQNASSKDDPGSGGTYVGDGGGNGGDGGSGRYSGGGGAGGYSGAGGVGASVTTSGDPRTGGNGSGGAGGGGGGYFAGSGGGVGIYGEGASGTGGTSATNAIVAVTADQAALTVVTIPILHLPPQVSTVGLVVMR